MKNNQKKEMIKRKALMRMQINKCIYKAERLIVLTKKNPDKAIQFYQFEIGMLKSRLKSI